MEYMKQCELRYKKIRRYCECQEGNCEGCKFYHTVPCPLGKLNSMIDDIYTDIFHGSD